MATTSMFTRCDICGDCGEIEAIITCCVCRVAREHLYCMSVVRTQAPPFWTCDECVQIQRASPKITDNEPKKKEVSTLMQQTTCMSPPRFSQQSTASKFNFKEKRVDKGRTKYLSCDEAVKLSSGSIKSTPTRKEFRPAHVMSKSMSPPRLFRQPSGLKEMATSSIKPPAFEKTHIKSPQKESNLKPNLQQPVLQQSVAQKGKPVPPFQNRGNATQSVNSYMPSKRVDKTDPEREMKTTKIEAPLLNKKEAEAPKILKKHENPETISAKNELLLLPKKEADISKHIEAPKILKKDDIPEKISGCTIYADVVAGRSDAGKPNLTSSLPVSEMHDPYTPSFKSYWKGCFYLSNAPHKFNDAFKAHLPSRVRYKVYEAAKKMPENIDFELISYNKIQMEILPADRDDIALYFFPMVKRSENGFSIADFIWRNNLVMKSNLEGLELIVLSSRVLPSHAQEFQGNDFLWGVFSRQKVAKKVADTCSLMVPNRVACDDLDVPPGFKKLPNRVACDDLDVPPGFKKLANYEAWNDDDVPPGFKKICKR